jgi:hypothetical protein
MRFVARALAAVSLATAAQAGIGDGPRLSAILLAMVSCWLGALMLPILACVLLSAYPGLLEIETPDLSEDAHDHT